LTAIVAAQIAALGSFQVLQLATVIAGALQIGFGCVRAGSLAAFFPSSVIKGMLAAIGVILILKQIPHVGHDAVAVSDFSFRQADHENTFSEHLHLFGDLHAGAAAIGLLSIAVWVVWERWKRLKESSFPAPLIVVLLGVGITHLFKSSGEM
jgi:carbonic anhydrase